MPVATIRLAVPFADKDAAKELARQAGGRLAWDPASRIWSFEGTTLPTALAKYLPATPGPARALSRTPGPVAPVPAPPKPAVRSYVLDVPFQLRADCSALGARWTPAHRATIYTGAALPRSLARFRSTPFSIERELETKINGGIAPDEDPSAGTGTITPRAHQVTAIDLIARAAKAKRPGFLLADDVGLGKTISAWGAVLKMPFAKHVLIICPLDVVPHWRNTLVAMGTGGREVLIINYDRLGKLFEVDEAVRAKVKSRKGLARRGEARVFDLIIEDESHRTKNPTTARSKFAAKLVAEAKFTLWLSATAGQNPLELSYLAPLLADVTGAKAKDLKDFEQWCLDLDIGVRRGAFGKWEWAGDPKDCDRIHAMLFKGKLPAGLRRSPSDIRGWPEINRILTPITLDPNERDLYDAAWTQFRKDLSLATKGGDPKNAMVVKLRFRQKGSMLRVGGTVALALSLLENRQQVAISVAFHETLSVIKAALEKEGYACAEIHGKLSGAQKEQERLRFQRGGCPVALFTVEEGISLHQGEHNDVPRSEIIHDLRWSAIQMAQVEGRCHRDGKFAQMYWTYAEDTVEEHIARVVAGRVQAMKGMLGDDRETLKAIESLLAKAL
jgi:hypothetical protein